MGNRKLKLKFSVHHPADFCGSLAPTDNIQRTRDTWVPGSLSLLYYNEEALLTLVHNRAMQSASINLSPSDF